MKIPKTIGLILLLFFFSTRSESQVPKQSAKNDLNESNKAKKFSVSYQASYYVDPQSPILYPLGIQVEYALGESQSSIDFQTIFYHPDAIHLDDINNYSFFSSYYVLYDLGYRVYFEDSKDAQSGAYFRPSIGISTVYSRAVFYSLDQNLGYEITQLDGKGFIGLQLGYKKSLNKLFFMSGSIGSLISTITENNEIGILFSPNINVNVGVQF